MPPKFYLSGRFSVDKKKEAAWLKRTGCTHRLFSYATVHPDGLTYAKGPAEAIKACEKAGINIMMDSGAHSVHVIRRASAKRDTKAKAKQEINMQELQDRMYKGYVQFCHENKEKWTAYITLDFERSQPFIYKMQQRFKKDGLAPMPVVHGESDITHWLEKHKAMGHDYICLGGISFHKNLDWFLDRAFDLGAKLGLRYHGLMLTSLKLITQFPFYSVDSSTWSRCAAFGQVVLPDFRRNRFVNVHVSERHSTGNKSSYNSMTAANKSRLDGLLKEHGFDIKAMRDGSVGEAERHDWNGYMYSNLEKFGIDWKQMALRKVEFESLI